MISVVQTKNCKMENIENYFKDLYRNFNERNIDLVISKMAYDVKWANGMDGGYVYGHDGVKEYWTRQFKLISSNVTPLNIDMLMDIAKIKVHQVVYDLSGLLLADELVYHYFQLDGDIITAFEIGDKVIN